MKLLDTTWTLNITNYKINGSLYNPYIGNTVYEWNAYTEFDNVQMTIRSTENFPTEVKAKTDFLTFRRKHKLKYEGK